MKLAPSLDAWQMFGHLTRLLEWRSPIVKKAFSVVAFTAVALLLETQASHAWALSLCATPKQASDIQQAYARQPGVVPLEIARKLGLTEETVVTGLSDTQSLGTIDGQSFAKVWQSLTTWEQPAVVIPLENDDVVEVTGRISSRIFSKDGEVQIETVGSGIGGHFHPSNIAAIHSLSLPRKDGQTLHGVIFFSADGKTIISVYAVASTKPALIALLSSDAYQKTRELIASLPRHCPK
ncbi:MAG: hypothetical protein K2P94_14495 [Rhodospirillaceae bacterium]|nr:hypothetical protein [Rhodospirillaceae bacterium]